MRINGHSRIPLNSPSAFPMRQRVKRCYLSMGLANISFPGKIVSVPLHLPSPSLSPFALFLRLLTALFSSPGDLRNLPFPDSFSTSPPDVSALLFSQPAAASPPTFAENPESTTMTGIKSASKSHPPSGFPLFWMALWTSPTQNVIWPLSLLSSAPTPFSKTYAPDPSDLSFSNLSFLIGVFPSPEFDALGGDPRHLYVGNAPGTPTPQIFTAEATGRSRAVFSDPFWNGYIGTLNVTGLPTDGSSQSLWLGCWDFANLSPSGYVRSHPHTPLSLNLLLFSR